jgi:enamine deaminase RidA (YjgF/YER057c/UK114 family)
VTDRRLISSGGPWEGRGGYSRAVVVGDDCWVSGTTDAGPDARSRHPGDIGAQTKAAFEIVAAALAEADFALDDVVRTRMFVTDISRADEVLAVHGQLFGAIRPAATMVQVAALIEPSLLVEVEVDAHRARRAEIG